MTALLSADGLSVARGERIGLLDRGRVPLAVDLDPDAVPLELLRGPCAPAFLALDCRVRDPAVTPHDCECDGDAHEGADDPERDLEREQESGPRRRRKSVVLVLLVGVIVRGERDGKMGVRGRVCDA